MILWKSSFDNSLLLFGGLSGSKVYGDTWSYSPDTDIWTFVGNYGPSPRFGSGYCTDTSNGYLFLFGGSENGEMMNDVWQYGPFTSVNIFQMIEWKLDSATLMATWAASVGTLVLLIIIVILMINWIRKCIINRKKRFSAAQRLSILKNGGHNDIDEETRYVTIL